MSLATFHDEQSAFFNAKSYPYVLTVYSNSSSFSFFANSLMSSMYIRWLIVSCDLLSLCIFWVCGLMASLKLWIVGLTVHLLGKSFFGSLFQPSFFSPAVNSTLQFFMFFFDEVYDLVWYFVNFETVIIQLCGIICLFVVIPGNS